MDWSLAAGIGAIVTGVLGVMIAVRETRRQVTRAANRQIRDLETALSECHDEAVAFHRQVYELRSRLADHGLDE